VGGFDHRRLLARPFPEVATEHTRRDVILYALGLGFGADPTDPAQLRFVLERDLEVFPTMPVVLGHPGPWMADPETGIDMVRVLHAEQELEIHRPPPVEGRTLARNRVLDVIDKGEGKGALIVMERQLHDAASGQLLCTQRSVAFARGNGGMGGTGHVHPAPVTLPDRAPDQVVDLQVSRRAALIYRLSGDYNPLHADPVVAARAGFPAPILHGLASYGMAARALLSVCPGARLRRFGVRFAAPVYPGEILRTELWIDGDTALFRSRICERDSVVLNNGHALLG
jgi:acyl dehydratase